MNKLIYLPNKHNYLNSALFKRKWLDLKAMYFIKMKHLIGEGKNGAEDCRSELTDSE